MEKQSAAKSIDNAYSTVSDSANEFKNKAESKMDEAKEFGVQRLREVTQNLGESASEIAKNTKRWTEENPLQTGLIGIGVGFVAGFLLRKAFSRSE